jgi:hypothetical protein
VIPEDLTLAAEQAALRARVIRAPADVLEGAFAAQRACVLDESPFKVEFCTRRAAKTYTWGLEAVHDSRRWPRASYLYLGLVKDEARRAFWKEVVKDIDLRYGVGMQFNETRLEATLPNGATIYVGAADANEQEMRKLLGQKYRKVLIDEAQDWHHTDLFELIFSVLKPAMADYRGSITLAGTPGRITKGYYYDVTTGAAPGWSMHEWTTHDNPYMAEKWAAEIADLKVRVPGIEETPAFRRNYLREWVLDDSALVYRYRAQRNDFDGALPVLPGPWHHVLGVDLGYNDDTAFVVGAWHPNHPVLHLREAAKQKGMDVSAVAERIKALRDRYQVETVVVDGSNKQAVAEMQNRHGLSLIPSDKTGKADFIELMNAEWTTGRVLLDPRTCAPLVGEYARLVWRDKRVAGVVMPGREEHPLLPNHACDAALYLWRYTYSYAHRPLKAPPREGSAAWVDDQARKMFERTREKVEAAKRDEASDPFGPGADDEGGFGQGYE